ncbi:hypothetical protein [Streptomyces sp. NBC_00557]|uniref:hypothetical protein n=1 Tax=Streptomyces sp. NBC_00557 TaxID=2975776 RepID=UPI002E81B4D6|nr:hypothetical protein [Streptomyces sp. NBC_00557]WUC35648.1 hypothetical protein OG956_16165 [Streptomyces sp. NBC_00557]
MTATQPVAGTRGVRHRVVHPAVLVALLLGLFLMHGGPAAAASGCHGGMPDAGPAVPHPAPAAPAEHPADHSGMVDHSGMIGQPATAERPAGHSGMAADPAPRSGTAAPPAHGTRTAADTPASLPHRMRPAAAPVAVKVPVQVGEGVRGALCQATTSRPEMPVPPAVAGVLVVPVVLVVPWGRSGADGARRRGPPESGRELLLQVCVART